MSDVSCIRLLLLYFSKCWFHAEELAWCPLQSALESTHIFLIIILLLEDCNMQMSAALTVKSIANMLIYLETVG